VRHRPSILLQVSLSTLFFVGLAVAADNPDTGTNILSPDDTIVAVKQTTRGAPNHLAATGDFGGTSGSDEQVSNAIDGDLSNKYFNKALSASGSPGIDTGFVITPRHGATIITGIQLATANDQPDRDPLTISIEGSNDPDADKATGKGFTLIYKGPSGLSTDPGRNTWGQAVAFTNSDSYKSYRVLITETRANADATQFSEVRLLGVTAN